MRKKLGECLVQAGLITESDLQTALAEHRRSGERLGAVLVRLNLATERQIAKALAYQLGFPYVNLSEHPPTPEAAVVLPKHVALEHTCVAIAVEHNLLTVAMHDPMLFTLVQDLEFQTGYRIEQVVATRTDIVEAIDASYPDTAAPAADAVPPADGGGSLPGDVPTPVAEPRVAVDSTAAQIETPPIVDLVDLVIKSAVESRASDIHIEPTGHNVVVRHRLDGLLKEVMDLPKWVHEGLVLRIKILAGMDIAEKRLPQDGHMRAAADDGQDVDLRASTLRTIFGEKIVLRVLDRPKSVPPLEELGLSAGALEQIRLFLRCQHGMLLVVGPTGSGRTTTLCSALMAARSERTNIVTIEDAVEYQIPGVNQTQIDDRIALTFASALRSVLRQDPDVVLVGEISDRETARMAMQAARTGRLVLSTLHSDDAPSAVTRLTDIGIDPYVSASALIGVVAQRLIRRLCSHCRQPYAPDAETLRAMRVWEAEAATLTFYRPVGCDRCNRTGYRGRIGICEIMAVGETLRRVIAQRGSEAQLRDAARSGGMMSLGEDGLLKVKAGLTSPEELLRVVTGVPEARAACPACAAPVSPEFAACPGCGQCIGGGCPQCHRPLEAGWTFCPYCAKALDTSGRRQEQRQRQEREGRELTPANVAEFKR